MPLQHASARTASSPHPRPLHARAVADTSPRYSRDRAGATRRWKLNNTPRVRTRSDRRTFFLRLKETVAAPGVGAPDDRSTTRRAVSQLQAAHVAGPLPRFLLCLTLLPEAFDLGVVRFQVGFDLRGEPLQLVLRAGTAREVPAVGLGVAEDAAAAVQRLPGARAPFFVTGVRSDEGIRSLLIGPRLGSTSALLMATLGVSRQPSTFLKASGRFICFLPWFGSVRAIIFRVYKLGLKPSPDQQSVLNPAHLRI